MKEGQETNKNLRFLSLDRAIFDGMASELLDKSGNRSKIPKITSIASLDEALSELRKCGVNDEDMADYLDKREKKVEEEFNKNRKTKL